MCGIVGIHAGGKSGFFSADKDQLRQMLVVNSLRGIHSTGMFGVDKSEHWNHEVSIVKSIGSPYMLFDWDKSDVFFSRMINTFGSVVGHGRWATRGDITADNAHPFKEGNITLVHNGVISNYHQLKDFKKHDNIEVDSQLIARLISEEGADEILPRIRGAYTFVWWDAIDKTLNLVRNKERPLFLAKEKKRNNVYFASEAETLVWNAMRSGVEYHSVQELPAFNHVKFKLGNGEPIEQKQFKEKYVSAPATIHTPSQLMESSKSEKVVSITPKINRKSRAGEFSSDEEHIFECTKHTHSINRGKEVVFILDDYKTMEKEQHAIIYGSSPNYPNVEFCVVATINGIDEILMNTQEVTGIVSSIFLQNSDTITDMPWKVYLNASSCFKYDDAGKPICKVPLQAGAVTAAEETSGEIVEQRIDDGLIPAMEYITLDGVAGERHSIAFHRLLDMSDKGCGWCEAPIKYEEVNNRKILYGMYLWEDDKSTHHLICPSCSEGYRKQVLKQRSAV